MAAYACVRMSHRERSGPPSLPLQLCGREELKKNKNWFDRHLLNLDALLWNVGYVRADGLMRNTACYCTLLQCAYEKNIKLARGDEKVRRRRSHRLHIILVPFL